MYLAGLTDFGDSVEDEWLIVYLLRELSLKDKNLWIRIADTDGEFLLIEAAEVLPRWLNPEIAENRASHSPGHKSGIFTKLIRVGLDEQWPVAFDPPGCHREPRGEPRRSPQHYLNQGGFLDQVVYC